MHLEDVQNAQAFSDIEKNLRMIQCFRSIAMDLITFLDQLEMFQKRLWTKKKFVVSSHYCISLDRVPEELFEEVVSNGEQWNQWRRLGLWNSPEKGDLSDLRVNPGLMLDTSLFSRDFSDSLVSHIENIDEIVLGVLVNGDNFHALNLLSAKYKRSIDFAYIDPPYNTVHSKISYKNQFDHSAWLSLINNTLPLCESLMKEEFSFGFAIDDYELTRPRQCEINPGWV